MSVSGGDMGEMGDRLSDADVESLITGSNEVDTSLAELIAEMRGFADWRPDPSRQASHIVGAMAAVRVTAEGAAGVVNDLSSPAMTRRQGMIGRIMATRLARVLAVALATLLATSGIAWAATGSNPVDQVTSVVDQVGHVFTGDPTDDQVDEADVDDSNDQLLPPVVDDNQVGDSVVDDTKDDDQVEETDVNDTEDDHAAVDDSKDDDQVEESDHKDVDEHQADLSSDHESETESGD